MKSNWRELPLGEITELVIDYRGKTPKKLGGDWSESGYRALSAKNIKTGHIVQPDTIRFVSEEMYHKWMKDEIQRGDIIITSEAPFGQILYWDSNEKIVLSQRLFGVRIKDGYDSRFVYYYMTTQEFQGEMDGRATGTTVVGLRQSELMKCIVRCPDLETQRKIASVLSSIDEKILLNEQINENLEQHIETIFNNNYAPSLHLANWSVGTVGDVVTLQRGYDLPKDKMVPGSYPVAGSTDTIFYHNDYTTEAPCVVMGRSGNIGKPRLYMERCWAHNTTLFVKDFKGNNPYWSYYMLRTIDYTQFQGGSAVPTLNRNHVHSYEIAIPPIAQQNEFAEQIHPFLLLIENNRMELKALTELRDTILPQLMSGELDISDLNI